MPPSSPFKALLRGRRHLGGAAWRQAVGWGHEVPAVGRQPPAPSAAALPVRSAELRGQHPAPFPPGPALPCPAPLGTPDPVGPVGRPSEHPDTKLRLSLDTGEPNYSSCQKIPALAGDFYLKIIGYMHPLFLNQSPVALPGFLEDGLKCPGPGREGCWLPACPLVLAFPLSPPSLQSVSPPGCRRLVILVGVNFFQAELLLVQPGRKEQRPLKNLGPVGPGEGISKAWSVFSFWDMPDARSTA